MYCLHNLGQFIRRAFLFLVVIEGFEQGGSEAEENSPVECFCRRANEQSEAREATASEKSLALG